MQRVEFLKFIWKPYPIINQKLNEHSSKLKNDEVNRIDGLDNWHCGRVVSFSEHQISIFNEKGVNSFTHQQKLTLIEGTEYLANDLLSFGDLIAIKNDQVILLSPNLIQALPWNYQMQKSAFDGFTVAPCFVNYRDHQMEQMTKQWKQKKQNLAQFQKLKNELLQFFDSEGFLYIETPSLVDCPGTEPSLEVFHTKLKIGRHLIDKYLPTSPELHLKKALTYGFEKIYELKSCFRNDEFTERHEPEFTMIEWYRSYSQVESIQKDVVNLIYFLSAKFQVQPPSDIRFFQIHELFKLYCDFDLKPNTNEIELRQLANRLHVDVQAADSIDDVFFLIFMEKIEPQFASDTLTFVTHYPPYQAALARLTGDGWGDRFEVYWKGLELANAFCELNNPQNQRMRSQQDLQKKVLNQKQQIQLDEDFFKALEIGMPPSSGIALGVERLAMAMFDIKSIQQLKLFSYNLNTSNS